MSRPAKRYPEDHPLGRAINAAGIHAIARACGCSYQSVQQWVRRGLPWTEFIGETEYATIIADISRGTVTKEALLEWTRGIKARSSAA